MLLLGLDEVSDGSGGGDSVGVVKGTVVDVVTTRSAAGGLDNDMVDGRKDSDTTRFTDQKNCLRSIKQATHAVSATADCGGLIWLICENVCSEW